MNAIQYDKNYDFPITGVSYIGKPRSNTAMYVTKKIESTLINLNSVFFCLVFIERDQDVPHELRQKHCFIECDNPAWNYAQVANSLWDDKEKARKKKKYTLTKEGYYIGENVSLGQDVTIECGVFIDHEVHIGDGSKILSGARISNSKIGKNCIIKQNAVIGSYGFVMTRDPSGNLFRISSLGNVIIKDEVEVGSLSTICAGTSGSTFIGEYVKIDDHVHIGHDVNIGKNVEITAGVIVGGFCNIGEDTFIGINSALRNRITIGKRVFIGMGAVVTKQIADDETVIGYAAKSFANKL